MSDERRRRQELEREADDIKAQVLVQWNRIKRVIDELGELRDEENERKSQSALPPYREELPSETNLSLRPTGIRLAMKNAKPSMFVIVVLVLWVVALVLVLVWLLRLR